MAKVIIIKEIKAKAGTLGKGMASGITEGRMAVREILEDTTKVVKATLVEKTKVAKVNGLIMGKETLVVKIKVAKDGRIMEWVTAKTPEALARVMARKVLPIATNLKTGGNSLSSLCSWQETQLRP